MVSGTARPHVCQNGPRVATRGRGLVNCKKRGGGPDFEAPTKDGHRGSSRRSRDGNPVASAVPREAGRARRTTALGKQCRANVNRGGTPQQDGLGNRTPPQ